MVCRFRLGADGYLADLSASVFVTVYIGLFAGFATLMLVPADGAQRMDSLMQELDSATEQLDTARMRILELEQQLAAAAPPVVVQGEFSAADQEVQATAAKTLRRARSHFDKADIDGSGDLEGDELKEVAAWVIKSFTPDGDTKPLDDAAINAEVAKLLRSADANNDGKISVNW